MSPEQKAIFKIFCEVSDDTTDAFIAYLFEKNKIKKRILSRIYERLDKKRSEIIERLVNIPNENS